jgi:hypothetical protein
MLYIARDHILGNPIKLFEGETNKTLGPIRMIYYNEIKLTFLLSKFFCSMFPVNHDEIGVDTVEMPTLNSTQTCDSSSHFFFHCFCCLSLTFNLVSLGVVHDRNPFQVRAPFLCLAILSARRTIRPRSSELYLSLIQGDLVLKLFLATTLAL